MTSKRTQFLRELKENLKNGVQKPQEKKKTSLGDSTKLLPDARGYKDKVDQWRQREFPEESNCKRELFRNSSTNGECEVLGADSPEPEVQNDQVSNTAQREMAEKSNGIRRNLFGGTSPNAGSTTSVTAQNQHLAEVPPEGTIICTAPLDGHECHQSSGSKSPYIVSSPVHSPNGNEEVTVWDGKAALETRWERSESPAARSRSSSPAQGSFMISAIYIPSINEKIAITEENQNNGDESVASQTRSSSPAQGTNIVGTPEQQPIIELMTPENNQRSTTGQQNSTGESTRKRIRSSAGSSSPKRKRARNPSTWKANIRKTLKNSGQAYISNKGKEMKGAQMRNPCSCQRNCRLKVTEDQRKVQFDLFWGIGNHERQWEFIRQHSTSQATQERKDFKNKKKTARFYFFIIDKEKLPVCKKMFMATLGIWDCWIDSAYKHINAEKGFVTTPDKRGRHKNHHVAITPEKIETVKEHCSLFPRTPSHYCRESSKREYLEHGLSLNKMAKLYITWAEEKGIPKSRVATIRQYKDVINSHYNIGFFKPKKDQCGLCSLIRSKHNPRQTKEKYKDLYAAHIKRKQLVKKIKLQDRAAAERDKNIAVVSFDLQKQLNCPRSEIGAFFYKNKLSVFNFTIFQEVERIGHCYAWHEGIGKKGSCEIASSLSHFIDHLVKAGHKVVIFYSDNCSGQNKNRNVFAMYQHKAVQHSIQITHRFLEVGHTHMDADTIHARIENSTSLKELMDFEDWMQAIVDAKEELPKYNVVRLKQSMIYNYKNLVSLQNWSKDLKGNDIKWKKVREVSVNGSEGNLIRIRYDLDGEIITLSPNRVGRPVNLKTYKPPREYNGPVPIKANKRADIESLCDDMVIPLNKQQFFRDVLAGTMDDELSSDGEYDTDEEIIAGIDPTEEVEELQVLGEGEQGRGQEEDEHEDEDEEI